MSTRDEQDRIELLQGTLDLLILRTLLLGPAHGHAIAKAIEQNSAEVLQVEQGSLYPALHRLIKRGWTPKQIHQRITSQMPVTEKIARAHFVIWSEGELANHSRQVECVLERVTA